jgi:hypothetical protein
LIRSASGSLGKRCGHVAGGSRLLSLEAFRQYVKTFPGADNTLGALQLFVQSSGKGDSIFVSDSSGASPVSYYHHHGHDHHPHHHPHHPPHHQHYPHPHHLDPADSAGHAGTIYRSHYKVTNDKGKVVMHTYTYTTITPESREEQVIYVNTDANTERPLTK